jgi:hypothetical protein
MKRHLALLSLTLLLLACKSTITLSGPQLLELTTIVKEPKVAIWYFTGSSDRYDYFYRYDLQISQAYRVPTGEITLTQRFPLTSDRKKWVVMPWGPFRKRNEDKP